jgi:hypothetical protein
MTPAPGVYHYDFHGSEILDAPAPHFVTVRIEVFEDGKTDSQVEASDTILDGDEIETCVNYAKSQLFL